MKLFCWVFLVRLNPEQTSLQTHPSRHILMLMLADDVFSQHSTRLPACVLCIYSAQQTACRGSFSFLTMTCVLFGGQYFWWVNSTQSETPGTQHRFSSVLDDSFNQTVLVCVLRLLLHSNTSVQINFHKLLKDKTPLDSSLNINTVTWSPETISSLLCGDGLDVLVIQDNQTWKSCLDGTWLSAVLMVYSQRMEVDGEYCEEYRPGLRSAY